MACTNVRAAVLDRYTTSATPGPIYQTAVPSVGKQRLSSKPSSAAFSFGTGLRSGPSVDLTPSPVQYNARKGAFGRIGYDSRKASAPVAVFGSSPRTPRSALRSTTPGPVYRVTEEIARSPNSRRRNAPKFSMGSSKKGVPVKTTASSTPGPGAYAAARSSIGKQTASQKPSSASSKFGTSKRDSSSPSRTPGPQYRVTSTALSSPDSRRSRAPTFKFGSSSKQSPLAKSVHENPGPGAYGTSSAIGRQTISKRPSSARADFGTSTRDSGHHAAESPSPGAYATITEAFGKQSVSRCRSMPSFGFGTSTRETGSKPSANPGPQYNLVVGGLGKQSVSSKRTSSRAAIGKASRWTSYRSTTPGPSAYQGASVSAFTKQSISKRRTAPAFTLGAR